MRNDSVKKTNKRQNYRRKPGNSKGKKSTEEMKEFCDERGTKSETNDPAWYAQNPELLRDAASFPFSNAAGVPFSLDVTSGPLTDTQVTIPAILTLNVIPCPGNGSGYTSALNVAATQVYSFVRHANSGSANYDSPDLMLYCLAMGQVYSYLNFLQRVYGTCQLYSNYNRAIPKAVIEAQGVNFTDLISHLADFRYGLNSLIHKAVSLACPADMPYFRRLAFLFAGLYSEGESVKDQLYMYVPEGFMVYSETTEQTGGSLEYSSFFGGLSALKTVDQLIAYGNSLLQPILMSEDMNIMSGDILKAYGRDGILTLQTVPEILEIMPTTDLAVLEQFQNANFIGSVPQKVHVYQPSTPSRQGSLWTEIQLDGSLASGQRAEAATSIHPLTTILTDPGPGDVMERTRLMASYSYAEDSGNANIFINCASEFATRLLMWSVTSQGVTSMKAIGSFVQLGGSTTTAVLVEYLNQHCELENFKFHPAVYYWNNNVFLNLALDFDNFTLIHDSSLIRMNEAAMLSLFNVNSIAKF